MTGASWDVRLPDGCLVEVARGPVERAGKWSNTVECRPGHEPVAVELELTADGSRLRARTVVTGETLPVAPHLDEDEGARLARLALLFAPPAPGTFRVWVDRMGARRQGRVVSAGSESALIDLTDGRHAVVPIAWLELPTGDEPPPEPVRRDEAMVAEATTRAAETGVRDAITRVYDVLRESDPDAPRVGLQVRASVVVREAAARLSDEAGRIAATMQPQPDTGEES